MKRVPKNYRYIPEKGLFEARFSYDGKRFSVYGATVKECEAKKAEKILDLENHMHIDNRKITLENYYDDDFIPETEKRVKSSTLYAYSKTWQQIRQQIGKMKITDIQKAHVLKMQKNIAENISIAAANKAVRLLSQILKSAISDRIIIFNPCLNVSQLKDDQKEKATDTIHRALAESEIKLFLQYSQSSNYYHLFRFLILTGCRVGEATALKWEDIKNNEIIINKTITRVKKGFEMSETPKTASSFRSLPITKQIAEVLKDQRKQQGYIYFNCPWVFPNSRGTMTNYNNINNVIKNIVARINANENIYFPDFSVHAFRDTFCTICAASGMQPNTLKKLAGHSSIKITMDIYAHVDSNQKKNELENISFAI